MSQPQSRKFISNLPLLHAIRGVAAFYVVVFHAKFILWSGGREYLAHYPRSQWSITDYIKYSADMLFVAGSQMVIIFFVLSGFFIAMSLENNKGSLLQKLKTFYAVRLIRIYFPYLFSILFSVLVLYLIGKLSPDLYHLDSNREFNNRLIIAHSDLTFSNFLKSLVFSKNQEYIGFNYAYWSLLYEGIFYLIVPFTYQFKKRYLIISTILYCIGTLIFSTYQIDNVFGKFIFEYNFYFAIGQALYIHKQKFLQIFKSNNYKWLLIGLSFILFLVFDILALAHLTFWANFLSALVAGLLIQLFLNYDIKNTVFIKGIKKLGVISYSLYLIHLPTLIFVYVLLHKYTGKIFFYNHIYLVGVFCALIAGYAFYKLFEEPSLWIIKKIKLFLKQKRGQLPAINIT